MQETKTYKKQSRIFLAQAFEELKKGDLPQASEKGWGAAAQMVKANAQERSWNHFNGNYIQFYPSLKRRMVGEEELEFIFDISHTSRDREFVVIDQGSII